MIPFRKREEQKKGNVTKDEQYVGHFVAWGWGVKNLDLKDCGVAAAGRGCWGMTLRGGGDVGSNNNKEVRAEFFGPGRKRMQGFLV